MPINVLITCGGGLQGATLIKELEDLSNVSIHVIDSFEDNLTKYLTPFYKRSPSVQSEQEYISFLLDYIEKNSIDYIIPATIYDLPILALLKVNSKVAVSDASLLKIFLDKRKTYSWLSSNNLPTFSILKSDELRTSLPIIGKDPSEWGGKGIKKIDNEHDLQSLTREEVNDLVWTKLLVDYEEYSVDFCINFKREVSKPIIRKRVRTLAGFAIITETNSPEYDSGLEKIVRKALEVICSYGGLGLFNLQILKSDDNYYISDINPRVGTSSVVAKYLNHNLCAFLLSYTGEAKTRASQSLKIVRTIEEKIIWKTNLKNIKAIVFDLDDTLIPHKPWIMKKLTYTIQNACFEINNKNEVIELGKMLVDEGKTYRLLDELCAIFQLDSLKEKLIATYRSYYPKEIEVYKDVADTLCYLSKKYDLCILTDNPIVGQKQKVEVFPYSNYFKEIIYTNALNTSKPDKVSFQEVSKVLSVENSELVMVGDNYHRDIVGAYRAGYNYCFQIKRPDSLFNSGPSSVPEYPANSMIINSLKELCWYL